MNAIQIAEHGDASKLKVRRACVHDAPTVT
jgi:hypothetical protein